MRQITFLRYGGPEVLDLAEADVPEPGEGQLLLRVSHSGVNFAEVMFRRGQIPVGTPHVPGLEAAGVVERVGAGVEGFAPGDRVAALTMAGGGQAEYAIAEAGFAVPLTGALAGVPGELAAAILCNATTAVGAIELCARPAAGERILVTAAAGGVGRCLLDLLTGRGFEIWAATGDPAKLAGVTADRVVAYDELGTADPFDVVFDSVGGTARKLVRDRIALLGRHVVMGDAAQEDLQVDLDALWFSGSTVTGYNLGGLAYGRPDVFARHLRSALGYAAAGRFSVLPQLVRPELIREAHTRLEDRSSTGKFVVAW